METMLNSVIRWLSKEMENLSWNDSKAHHTAYEMLRECRGFHNDENKRDVLHVIWTGIAYDYINANKIHKILRESPSFENRLLGELVMTASPNRNAENFYEYLTDSQVATIVNKLFEVIREAK